MKIALVIEQMDTARGGREVSTAQIAGALARRGQQVTVICQRSRWQCEGVAVHALGTRGLVRTSRFRNFVADVGRYLRENRFDVVHTVAPVPGANFYQPRGGTLPGNAVARERQGGGAALRQRLLGGLYVHRRMLGEMERRLVEDPRVTCLAVSEMVAEEFRVHYGRRDRLRVVYNGVDVPEASPSQREAWRAERRATLGVTEQDTVFLCVAQNFSLKGVEQAMGHFLRWCDSRGPRAGKARLVVVGRGLDAGNLLLVLGRRRLPAAELVRRLQPRRVGGDPVGPAVDHDGVQRGGRDIEGRGGHRGRVAEGFRGRAGRDGRHERRPQAGGVLAGVPGPCAAAEHGPARGAIVGCVRGGSGRWLR
jgi:glycosyltransferase involved in cell wall biosynthesis